MSFSRLEGEKQIESQQTRWDITSQIVGVSNLRPSGLPIRGIQDHVDTGSFPSGHVAKSKADLGQVVHRENNINGLTIPRQEYFGLLV